MKKLTRFKMVIFLTPLLLIQCQQKNERNLLKEEIFDFELRFAVNLLPKLEDHQLHIVRMGSIQYSPSFAVLTILKNDKTTAQVRYSEINAPFNLERFPDKSYTDNPTLKSYYFKMKISNNVIQRLTSETSKYSQKEFSLNNDMFASKVKSEGINGNQYFIIWPKQTKIGIVNKFSSIRQRDDLFELFRQISLNEYIQLVSLDCKNMRSIDSARWYLEKRDSLNAVRHFAIAQ